jgi:hypothetical protein
LRGSVEMKPHSRKGYAAVSIAIAAASFVAGCGDGADQRVVREYDGAELVALLRSARDAINQNDEAAFERVYAAEAQGDDWGKLETTRWNWGDYLLSRLTEAPGLDRKETGIHIERLDIEVWFDFSKDSGEEEDVYRTTWSLVREDSLWRLNYVNIDKNPTGYGQWIRGLHRMGYREFLTMAMDWEEGYDQTSLLARAWDAVAAGDAEALKPLYVDGTLFYALRANVAIPGVINDEYGPGENNRSNAHGRLVEQVKRMRETTAILEVEPPSLAPFYSAYRITSLPDDCTKLTLTMEFGGDSVPSDRVTRFSLIWTGVFLKSRWLVETMHVERIHFE